MATYKLTNFHEVRCRGNGCGLVFACQTDHRKADCPVTLCYRCDPERLQAKAEHAADRRTGR